MNYSQDHDQHQKQAIDAQQIAAAEKAWNDFIQLHPELRAGGFANNNILIGYFGTDYPANFTLYALEESYTNPNLKKQLSVDYDDLSVDRKKLIAELRSVFRGPAANLENELLNTRYMSNDQIREKIEWIQNMHESQKLSTEELRQVIRTGTAATEREVLPADMTRKYLLKLAPTDLRRAISKYGSGAINRRLSNQG